MNMQAEGRVWRQVGGRYPTGQTLASSGMLPAEDREAVSRVHAPCDAPPRKGVRQCEKAHLFSRMFLVSFEFLFVWHSLRSVKGGCQVAS